MASYDMNELLPEAKSRYLEKLKLCDLNTCPYQLQADAWENNPNKWPSLEWPEVYDYLINTPGVFTREAMKNRKSLEAHNQQVAGVRTVFHYQKEKAWKYFLMKADVTPLLLLLLLLIIFIQGNSVNVN